jgi:hypothetical protein
MRMGLILVWSRPKLREEFVSECGNTIPVISREREQVSGRTASGRVASAQIYFSVWRRANRAPGFDRFPSEACSESSQSFPDDFGEQNQEEFFRLKLGLCFVLPTARRIAPSHLNTGGFAEAEAIRVSIARGW